MKTKHLLPSLLAIMILLGSSCSDKTVTRTKTTTETSKEPIPWKHPKNKGGPELPTTEILGIQFSISEQTKIDQETFHSITIIENGLQKDSTWATHDLKYVDINELGTVRTVARTKAGKVVGLYVTFDDEEPEQYELYFKKRSDGYFYLTTITGKEHISRNGYKRRVYSTEGCKLLVNIVSKKTNKRIKSHAGGSKVKD